MKTTSSPHFNDGRKGAFWFDCKFIIDLGVGSFISLYYVQECSLTCHVIHGIKTNPKATRRHWISFLGSLHDTLNSNPVLLREETIVVDIQGRALEL